MPDLENTDDINFVSRKNTCQRPNADKIPCPALLSFYNNGQLNPADDGTVTTEHLKEVLANVGASSMVNKLLVNAADKTDDIPESFNLFRLRDSILDHTGSTGIRDPEVNPSMLHEALLQFSQNGRMYAADFAKAAGYACARDPGLQGTTIQNIEFLALLEVFGRADEDGHRYLTNEDVAGLWLDGKFPDGWTPRKENEVSLFDVLVGIPKMSLQRLLGSWPKLFG